jgi:hypothetical protein
MVFDELTRDQLKIQEHLLTQTRDLLKTRDQLKTGN